MRTDRFYIIQLVEKTGYKYNLSKDCRKFHWKGFGGDKEYKLLGAALKMAHRCRKRLDAQISPDFSDEAVVQIVEVTFQVCNPELPDGFYKPVERVLHSIY